MKVMGLVRQSALLLGTCASGAEGAGAQTQKSSTGLDSCAATSTVSAGNGQSGMNIHVTVNITPEGSSLPAQSMQTLPSMPLATETLTARSQTTAKLEKRMDQILLDLVERIQGKLNDTKAPQEKQNLNALLDLAQTARSADLQTLEGQKTLLTKLQNVKELLNTQKTKDDIEDLRQAVLTDKVDWALLNRFEAQICSQEFRSFMKDDLQKWVGALICVVLVAPILWPLARKITGDD